MNLSFAQNQLLFGWNETEGIVALELENDWQIRLYRRVNETLVSEVQPFHPVLWLQEADLLKDFKGEVEMVPLSGTLTYRVLAVFNSWKEITAAKQYRAKSKRRAPPDKSYPSLF